MDAQKPSNSCGAGDEKGRHDHLSINSQLQLCWQEKHSAQRQVRAQVVEVGKSSIEVKSERRIAAGTVVFIYTSQFTPIGRATVRNCAPNGMDYRIALYVPDRFLQEL